MAGDQYQTPPPLTLPVAHRPELALSVMAGPVRHHRLSPPLPALSVIAGSLRHGRACPGHPRTGGCTTSTAIPPTGGGWPGHAHTWRSWEDPPPRIAYPDAKSG